jgi:hypothetical protein
VFAKGKPGPLRAILAVISTWAFLGIPFALIDKFGVIDLTGFRSASVMEDGNDLAFLPLLIPLISLVSGAAYFAAAWLAHRFAASSHT